MNRYTASNYAERATGSTGAFNSNIGGFDEFSNLPDYYQTFNRNYDAALGRFVGVDPEAESAESLNTYNYAGNNPVMFNDPLGNKTIPAYLSQQIQDGINATLLGGGGGNMDSTTWQDQGVFDDQGPFSTDNGAAGRAFWFGAEYSGGDLDPAKGNVVNIYHAGDGTSDDPHTGLSLSQLVDLNNGGTVAFGNGGVSYEYQTEANTIPAQGGIGYGGGSHDHFGFIAANQGGQQGGFPSFNAIWANYPCTNAQGLHSFILSQSQYYNQCAIRLGSDLIQSGANLSNYKGAVDPKTGYPLGATDLANWVKGQLGNPMVFSYDAFTEYYNSHAVQGIIYELPNGGPAHIDLIYNGNMAMPTQVGEDFYKTNTIWYWPVK